MSVAENILQLYVSQYRNTNLSVLFHCCCCALWSWLLLPNTCLVDVNVLLKIFLNVVDDKDGSALIWLQIKMDKLTRGMILTHISYVAKIDRGVKTMKSRLPMVSCKSLNHGVNLFCNSVLVMYDLAGTSSILS